MIGTSEEVASPNHRRADLLPILTLFLLLIAFFVLLGAISKLELNRTQAVLGSLNATFRTTDPQGERREFGSLTGQIVGAEILESRLDRALRTAVGVDQFDLQRFGTHLKLSLAVDSMFQSDTPTALPGLADVSEVIAVAMGNQVRGADFQPEIYVEDAGSTGLPADRAITVGQALVTAGVDPHRFSVGLKVGTPRSLEIVFRPRPAESRP